ncbi:MAG: YceI family protein [Bacteroidetes bacterium]|nr:MAG: YceI family protein [Bacteroidota bacterium]
MKKLLFTTALAFTGLLAQAQLWTSTSSSVTFYSYTPMENIDATSDKGIFILNPKTGDVNAKVEIKSFHFKNGLMEEHFNENYMETDKEGPKDTKGKPTYPNKWAQFKGKIQETIDYTKDGTYDITMKGTFTCHNVGKEKLIKGKMTVKGGVATIDAKFDVPLKDHDIAVPEAVGTKIAQVIQVTIKATLQEKKKG